MISSQIVFDKQCLFTASGQHRQQTKTLTGKIHDAVSQDEADPSATHSMAKTPYN
jgi:hypothetical protein